ncbi:hypothetical protein C475_22404 [Halosimplex carlsbadense 2-9-1]|uniref:Uncharacterized protein n=1 Tax=Halosimplex carlsbadense 2-9-1 TaxID=797114 RepID=M0CBK7_9EURY|nr:hypothetical protein C475_22404 [Halosimplex carlsbadense 2-9-1]
MLTDGVDDERLPRPRWTVEEHVRKPASFQSWSEIVDNSLELLVAADDSVFVDYRGRTDQILVDED